MSAERGSDPRQPQRPPNERDDDIIMLVEQFDRIGMMFSSP